DTMRELVSSQPGVGNQESGVRSTETDTRKQAVAPGLTSDSRLPTPGATVWHGVAQLLEATCAALSEPSGSQQIPVEIRDRIRAALRSIASKLGADSTQ